MIYKIRNFIDNIPLNIVSFIQRGRRGWSSRDTWSFCYYLADVISEGLKHLKKYNHGHPGDITEEGWNKVLDHIIKTFETVKYIDDGIYYYIPSEEFTEEKFQNNKEICATHNQRWDGNDKVMTLEESIEFEKGFDLFKKYFFSLWD